MTTTIKHKHQKNNDNRQTTTTDKQRRTNQNTTNNMQDATKHKLHQTKTKNTNTHQTPTINNNNEQTQITTSFDMTQHTTNLKQRRTTGTEPTKQEQKTITTNN